MGILSRSRTRYRVQSPLIILIESMEAAGLVGPLQSNGAREVLAPGPSNGE